MHTHTRKRQGFHICDGEGVRMCMHVCVCAWKGVELLSVKISSRHRRNLFPRQKRPVVTTKETCIRGKRNLHWWQKRPAFVTKETCMCDKRNLCSVWRPIHTQKGPMHTQKKTYWHKRDLFTHKRDPFTQENTLLVTLETDAIEKRPMHTQKETYSHKWDQFTHKRHPYSSP